MSAMAPTKPSLELLRSLSDEHVLRALMSQRQATRAEIAAATGLSKPTVSESVRRLSASGLRRRHRGAHHRARPGRHLLRVARHHGLRAGGQPRARGDRGRGRRRLRPGRRAVAGAGDPSPGAGQVARTLTRRRRGRRIGPFRLAVVSAADPVDRRAAGGSSSCRTRRSCSARWTRRPCWPTWSTVPSPSTTTSTGRPAPSTATPASRDFVYLFLGEGLGCAVVSDGEVRRGHAGPGRRDRPPAHGRPGRGGDAADRRLRRARPSPPRLDRDRRAGAAAGRRDDTELRDTLGRAVAGVLSAVVALPIRRWCWSAARGAAIRACSRRWRASSRTRRAASPSRPPP